MSRTGAAFWRGCRADAAGMPRLVDDCAVDDTGSGMIAYLDLGAFELQTSDADADGVQDECDVCVGFDDTADADVDGIPDGCDACPGSDDTADADADGVPDGCDLCADADDSIDTDADGTPDGCDACPNNEDAVDADNDGVSDCDDLCPDTTAGVAVDGHGCPTPASGDSGNVNGNDNAAQDADPDERDVATEDDAANDNTTEEAATAPAPECGCGASGGVMMPVGLIGLAGLRRRMGRSARRAM